ncbi:MAG: hypothetical protein K6F53_08200 [Lachnospiraceae bacterium]|nr:hypothetical protein [Lachnospiraceae bacterium]
MEEKLKKITCPNCGASIEVDLDAKSGRCAYCNTFFYLVQ